MAHSRSIPSAPSCVCYSEDPRRDKPLTITWRHSLCGVISIEGELWVEVEWSHRRNAWCIQDAQGQCLHHEPSIHAVADSQEAAMALAQEMIRDRRLPSPQEARRQRWASLPDAERKRLEQRAAAADRRRAARWRRSQQPAEQQRQAERQALREAANAAWLASIYAQQRDRNAAPLYEILAETFDFSDPELWKSNSFAALRPRLITHVEAVVADLERQLATARLNVARRGRVREPELAKLAPRLAKAREILRLLQGERTSTAAAD